jgi:hypothetical protein
MPTKLEKVVETSRAQRYYKLPSVNGEGWAHIAINTETGFFATVSDWGNFSYIWTAPRCEFRKFLTEIRADYLYGKLMMGRPYSRVFDGRKTVENIRERLLRKNNKETPPGWAFYEEELELLLALGEDPGKSELEVWESQTRLLDVWEHAVYSTEPQCTSFCEKVWPRFCEVLRAELHEEAKNYNDFKAGNHAEEKAT